MVDEIERARSALQSLSPDVGRAEWVKIGMAAHAAGLSLQDFMEFSRPGATFNESACKATWRSFKNNPAGGVTAAALFGMARDAGWTDDGTPGKPTAKPPKAVKTPPEPPREPAPGKSAAEVWGRAVPLTMPTHPYLVRKQAAGVPLGGLRVLPLDDSLTIAGQSMGGALLVPAATIDGALQSLQLIPPQGQKMNLPGCPISGALHIVGELVSGGVAYVCEGVATAWTCWQATGDAAVCAFGWGNVGRVAEILRQRDKAARIVICPDRDKESQARTIAARLGCSVAELPPGLPGNTDINDYMQTAGIGIDVVQDLLEAALNAQHAPDVADSQDNFNEPQGKPLALDMVSVSDVLTNPSPPPVFVWAGYLPRGVVSLFGAHGGTGKSTIALMLATAAALGRPLFGVDTVQCKTLFFSAEDNGAIVRHRLATICRAWQVNPADLAGQLQIVDGTENPELFTADARAAGDTTSTYSALLSLVQAEGFGLVIADNASDTFGGDEINRRQVRAFMRALNRLATVGNCAILLLAHVDKSTSRNGKGAGGEAYSGSTAWHNSARSRLFMARSESGTLEIAHQKSNFGRMQAPLLLQWPDGGLPMLAEGVAADFSGLMAQAQGRNDDNAAAALLKLIAEFESRGQFAAPAPQARNNVHALLRSESAFKALGLTQDDTKRIVNQCQRAGWIAPLEYRTSDRKNRERWTVTEAGRAFAGLFAPTAPTAPTY